MTRRPFFALLMFVLVTRLAFAAGPVAFERLMEQYPNVADNYAWESYQRGAYLIVGTDVVFDNPYMDFFRVHKERQGFKVYEAPLSATGTTSNDIKAYIADFAATHELEYVLLIGDVDGAYALPSFYFGAENDVTDLPYVLLEGETGDYFPEAFVGRWPVDTAQELVKVILRTIAYAESPDLESGYLDKALVTAGNYADTGTILTPVWTSYWLRNELNDFGYESVDTVFYPPTTGAEQILEYWNSGVGVVNYRGWGDAHGWHFPHFHVSDFSDGALSNSNKLPVVFSFVCGTGKFDSSIDPAFCEALLTQGSLSISTGAVAVVAPSDLHTRTKFNNALNSKLWDALMEGHVSELGPALLASKFGFTDEFVNELDPGEMAEFYFHTYNILGDPSIPVWLGSPELISLSESDFGTVTWDDALITLNRPDLDEGVFALRQNDQLIGSGRWTDGEIRIYRFDGASFHDSDAGGASLEITLNSPGHVPATIALNPVDGNGVAFAGMEEEVHAGMTSWTPRFYNHSGSAVTAEINLSGAAGEYSVDLGSVSLPAGTITTLNTISAPVIHLSDRETVLNITLNGSGIPAAIPIYTVAPTMALSFEGTDRPLPGDAFTMHLEGRLAGMQTTNEDISVTVSTTSDFVTFSDVSGVASLDEDGTLLFSDPTFAGSLADVAHGSQMPLRFDFYLGTQAEPFYHKEFMVIVGSTVSTDPTPPRTAMGYWAYDNTDVLEDDNSPYPETPAYEWVDISALSAATEYEMADDDHEVVSLPFDFTYYGESYNTLTINSNGWAAFGADYINYFRNWSIPMPLGPDAMLAPFWDDLDNDTLVNGQEEHRPIFVYSYHDASAGTYTVQWDEVWNGFGDRTYLETFQVILYDPATLVADDGNGVIEFQYFEVNDVDQINNFSTVGIESPNQNDGLMYAYALNYAPGAAVLESGRAIRFTTNAPPGYIVSSEPEPAIPAAFHLNPAYPNPFNGMTVIPFTLERHGDVNLQVFDLRGRLVRHEQLSALTPGTHQIHFSGEDLESGVYLMRLSTGNQAQVQKVTLLK